LPREQLDSRSVQLPVRGAFGFLFNQFFSATRHFLSGEDNPNPWESSYAAATV
jgi:hypothetical protein